MSGSAYALVVLFAINLMNFFDRQLLGGVGEGIRREWALSDTALGLLGTVFTLLYAVVGLPLGRLSDKIARRKILAAGVFVWSLLTALSGLARSFSQLIVARLGVGVGEATCSPASTSLIGDLVPVDDARARRRDLDARPAARPRPGQRRGRMDPAELGLAQRVLRRGGARASCARSPRGRCASRRAARSKRTPSASAAARAIPYLLVLSIPTMLWVIAVGRAAQLQHVRARRVRVAVSRALPSHELRQRRLGRRPASTGSPASSAWSVGGWLADRLYATRVDGRLIVGTAAIVICTPLMFLGLGAAGGDVVGFALLMGVGVGVMFAYYSTVYSTIHDVVEPSLRGTAMALYFFAMYVLGASLGPVGHRAGERLLHVPEGERGRRGRAAAVRRDHDGGTAQPGRRVEGVQPEGARAVPRRGAAHGDVHRARSWRRCSRSSCSRRRGR